MTTLTDQPISPQPDAFLRASEFDGDEQDWYIEQRAMEIGADPREALRDVRATLRRREREAREALWKPKESPPAPAPSESNDHGGALAWPPGRAGNIARFLYRTSYSPIQEVAITATLGLLAGVCGRAYRTHTGKDLALYIILVAKSGVGKDALHEGIPMMLDLADRPMARDFVRASDFASGEALHKTLLRAPGLQRKPAAELEKKAQC